MSVKINGVIEVKKSFLRRLFNKITKNQDRLIKEYKCKDSKFIAFIYYKFIDSQFLKHTNNQEIKCIIETLSELSFTVFLVDRSCSKIPKRYLNKSVDLLIGADGYGGCKYYFDHLENLKPLKNILIMTKLPPSIALKRLNQRKLHRQSNLNIYQDYYRDISRTEIENFNTKINKVDKILFPDFNNTGIKEEFINLSRKIETLNWSTLEFLKKKGLGKFPKKEFICMCGNDHLLKGIDYLIEIFGKLPYKVHILSPDKKFIVKMLEDKKFNNIICYDFINLQSEIFEKIIAKCDYAVDFSCADACPTSLLNLMKIGLVPIIDLHAFPINLEFGLTIDLINNDLDNSRKLIEGFVENMTQSKYKEYSNQASNLINLKYSLENYKRQLIQSIKS